MLYVFEVHWIRMMMRSLLMQQSVKSRFRVPAVSVHAIANLSYLSNTLQSAWFSKNLEHKMMATPTLLTCYHWIASWFVHFLKRLIDEFESTVEWMSLAGPFAPHQIYVYSWSHLVARRRSRHSPIHNAMPVWLCHLARLYHVHDARLPA